MEICDREQKYLKVPIEKQVSWSKDYEKIRKSQYFEVFDRIVTENWMNIYKSESTDRFDWKISQSRIIRNISKTKF